MMIIGCDLHTRYQQIAMLDTETAELVERRLEHESGEARHFCAALARSRHGYISLSYESVEAMNSFEHLAQTNDSIIAEYEENAEWSVYG
jgi:hypothetical protein